MLISMANLLGAGSLAIIVKEMANIAPAFQAAENYCMRETLMGGDGKTYVLPKSMTDIYVFSEESWEDVTEMERSKFNMTFRIM